MLSHLSSGLHHKINFIHRVAILLLNSMYWFDAGRRKVGGQDTNVSCISVLPRIVWDQALGFR